MPIQVSEHTLTASSPDHFAQVLREDAEAMTLLRRAREDSGQRAFEAVFNGRPVALMLLVAEERGQRPLTLVVHPATRGRGVGTDFLARVADALGEPLLIPDECRRLADRAGLG